MWAGAIVAEAGLAAALAAGLAWAPAAATALLAGFAVLQAVALARGGSGAPCGCFGARGRLSPGALGRTALLAAACAALPALGDPAQPPLALTAALAAGAVALALGRPGAAPSAALEIDGEGPPLGVPSPVVVPGEGIRLALFTAEGCRLCRRVRAAADLFAAHGVPVGRFDERADAPAWAAAAVPGAPYAVAIGPDGTVLAKGTVNAASQLESVLAAGEQRWATSAAGSDAGDAGVRERAALGADDVGRAAAAATRCTRVGAATTPPAARPRPRRFLPPRLPRPRGRDRRVADRRRRARRDGAPGRGRGVPLLRPHLHDRLLPAPDRPPADRRQRPAAAREGRPAASTTSAA